MLTLAKTELPVQVRERVARIDRDVIALRTLNRAEIRAVYADLERARDLLSLLLDAADGK